MSEKLLILAPTRMILTFKVASKMKNLTILVLGQLLAFGIYATAYGSSANQEKCFSLPVRTCTIKIVMRSKDGSAIPIKNISCKIFRAGADSKGPSGSTDDNGILKIPLTEVYAPGDTLQVAPSLGKGKVVFPLFTYQFLAPAFNEQLPNLILCNEIDYQALLVDSLKKIGLPFRNNRVIQSLSAAFATRESLAMNTSLIDHLTFVLGRCLGPEVVSNIHWQLKSFLENCTNETANILIEKIKSEQLRHPHSPEVQAAYCYLAGFAAIGEEDQGSIENARYYFERAAGCQPENTDYLLSFGYILAIQGQLDESFKKFENALNLSHNPLDSALILNNLNILARWQSGRNGLGYLEQALSCMRRKSAPSDYFQQRVAISLSNSFGNQLVELGLLDEAHNFYMHGIQLYEAMDRDSLGQHTWDLGFALYNNLGSLEIDLGNLTDATAYFVIGKDIYDHYYNRPSALSVSVSTLASLITLYRNLAFAYRQLKFEKKATTFDSLAQSNLQRLKDSFFFLYHEISIDLCISEASRILYSKSSSNYAFAEELLANAMSHEDFIERRNSSRKSMTYAICYSLWAEISSQNQDTSYACLLYKMACNAFKTSHGEGNLGWMDQEANCHGGYGRILIAQNRLPEAMEELTKAESIYREIVNEKRPMSNVRLAWIQVLKSVIAIKMGDESKFESYSRNTYKLLVNCDVPFVIQNRLAGETLMALLQLWDQAKDKFPELFQGLPTKEAYAFGSQVAEESNDSSWINFVSGLSGW